MIAYSFLHGGPPVFSISRAVVDYLVSDIDEIPLIEVPDIPDIDLRIALTKVSWKLFRRSELQVQSNFYKKANTLCVRAGKRSTLIAYHRIFKVFVTLFQSPPHVRIVLCK